MEANELRLGNWISLGNRIGYIQSNWSESQYIVIDEEETQDTIEAIDRFKPIKLTKEWMIKFGFEEDREWTFNKGTKDEWITTLDGFSTEEGSEGFRLEWCENKLCFELYYHYEEIKTVHRLQNLYFALTEKELKLIN